MVLALRSLKEATIRAMGMSTQLDTQAAAVTAVAYTASGAIAEADNVITIATDAQAYTIAQPRTGRILVIKQSGAGTITVTLTQGTYDGTNNTATFNAANETLVLLGISDKRFLILDNIGSVALSSV
jgi:hypothetical protein